MKAIGYIVVSLMTLAASLAFGAKPLPQFDAAGTIDRLDYRSGEIVVGDIYYRLGQNLIIYDEKGRLGGPKLLRQGVKVGITPMPREPQISQTQTLYEIRVLPKNFDLSTLDDDD